MLKPYMINEERETSQTLVVSDSGQSENVTLGCFENHVDVVFHRRLVYVGRR